MEISWSSRLCVKYSQAPSTTYPVPRVLIAVGLLPQLSESVPGYYRERSTLLSLLDDLVCPAAGFNVHASL